MRNVLMLLALAAAACTPEDFPTETLVDRLRMLGVKSTPADLAPGETARLQPLVVDPTRAGQPTTTFWIGCDPDPLNLNRSACSDPAVVNDPSRLGDMMSLPPGVKFIGLNGQALYSAPRGLFDALAADDSARVTGTSGQVLTISIAEDVSPTASMEELRAVFARVQQKEVKSLISLFRVRISEDPERNTNPRVTQLSVDDVPWPAGARVMVKPAQQVRLDVEGPDEIFEPFTAQTPNGAAARTERVLIAWYSTSGRFTEERTALREGVKTKFTAPGGTSFDPVPERRTGTLWVVLRDTRGGLDWSEYPTFVCDTSLPEPIISGVRPVTSSGDALVLEGSNLSSVLDVLVGGVTTLRGRANGTGTAWEGAFDGTLASGPQPVVVHTRRCERLEAGNIVLP
jgi:hypothetical protein